MWRAIWRLVLDVGQGPDGVTFHKIRAHMAQSKIAELPEAERLLHKANAVADFWAKEGAAAGRNVFLAFIGQACDEQAQRVQGAHMP